MQGRSLNMVYIASVENLIAKVTVSEVRFNTKERKARFKLTYSVSAGRQSADRRVDMEIQVDQSTVATIEEMLNDETAKLNAALDNIKKSLVSLFKLTPYVEVDLDEMIDELMKEVKGSTTGTNEKQKKEKEGIV